MPPLKPSASPISAQDLARAIDDATRDATSNVAQILAQRRQVQQATGAERTNAKHLPAALGAATSSLSAQAAAQQTLVEAKPGDMFGDTAQNAPLAAGTTLVGSSENPNALSKEQLHSIAHDADSTLWFPPPDAKTQPLDGGQSRVLIGRMAQMRGVDASELLAQLQPNETKPAATKAGQTKAPSTSALRSKLVANLPQSSNTPLTGAAMLATPGAQKSVVGSMAPASNATSATLGAAAPDASGAAGAASTGPSAPTAPLADAQPTSRALATSSPANTSAQSSNNTSSSSTAAAPQSQFAKDTANVRAKAIKRGDLSVGANDGLTGTALEKRIQDAWAAVDKAGQHQNFSGPINWQSFFNLLAARNAKLIGMFIQLQRESMQIDSQTSIMSLKLDKDSKEANISFDKAQALLQLSRAIYSLHNWSSSEANRIIFNQSPFLTSTELDLNAGLGNRQMQAPIQRTYQRNFVNQLAGSEVYTPLLQDREGRSRMEDFRTAKHEEIARDNPSMSQEEVHKQAAAYYRDRPDQDPAHKVMTSYTSVVDGKEIQVPIERRVLADTEVQGLTAGDQARNAKVMKEVDKTMHEDVTARVEMYLTEIQTLESAADKTSNPNEKAAFLQRAKELRPKYEAAQAAFNGAMDTAGPLEKRYDESLRNRGRLEEIRRNAERELSKTQVVIDSADADAPASASAREHARAQKEVYQQTVDTINRKCAIIDAGLKRYFDPASDNRRGRHQTGAHAVAQAYRSNRDNLAAARAKLAAHPNPSDGDHKVALRDIQKYTQQQGEFLSYPAFFKNPVKLHETLLHRMLTHQRDTGATLTPQSPLFEAFTQELRAANTAGHPQAPDALSLEGVSRTRMLTHLKERSEELQDQPATHPEKQAIAVMREYWKQSPLLEGYEQPVAKKKALHFPQTVWSAARNNIVLRGDRNKDRSITEPKNIPNPSTEQYWRNEDGTQGAKVNFADRDEASRFYSAQAATNGNILAMQNEVAGGGGAFRNNAGHRLEKIENTLQNLSINATSHLQTLEDFVSNTAQGLSSDAQESLSDFMSLLAQAQQVANSMVLQMYQSANAKVGR